MAIANQDKPTTSIANSLKISIGETWDSITTTWSSETRTWLAVSQLITNTSKIGLSYLLKEDSYYILLENGYKIYISDVGLITNQPKP